MLTWRELARLIRAMSAEQQDTDVTVFIRNTEELGSCPAFFCATMEERDSPDPLDGSLHTLTIQD